MALRSRAAQLRLQAMRSQLTAATNFCLAAENALIVGRLQLVGDAVERAKHTVQQVRAHLEEPNHIPADSVAGIRDRLEELEKQISDLEAGLQSQLWEISPNHTIPRTDCFGVFLLPFRSKSLRTFLLASRRRVAFFDNSLTSARKFLDRCARLYASSTTSFVLSVSSDIDLFDASGCNSSCHLIKDSTSLLQ